MADSDVKFTVVADTGEAKRDLSDLEKAAERVQSAANRGGGGGGGGGGGNPPRPTGEGEEFGKAAGKQIGKALAGFMAREASSIVFSELRRRGIGGSNLDIAQGAIGGALAFGTTGAMLGGPLGALVGAGLGAAAGGFKSWQDVQKDEAAKEMARNQQLQGLDIENAARERSLAAMKYMTAQGRLFDSAPNREARVEMIGKEADALGEMLSKVTMRIRKMIESGTDPNNSGLLAARMERSDIATRLQQLETMKFNAGLMDPIAMASAAEFSDAFSKRGLYVGGQVDVGNVNERIAATNEAQLDVLRQIAESMRNISTIIPAYASTAAMESARQRELGRRTWAPEIADTTGLDPESPAAKIISRGYRGGAIWTR